MTYIEKQLEELNEKLDPFLRECYVGRGPDLVPTIRKLENKLRPVQKENIDMELNKEATESEKKLKRHLKDCERDVLHLRIVWKAIYDLLKIGAKGNNPECRGMIVSLLLWVKNENKSLETDGSKEAKKDVEVVNSWLDETSDSKDMSTVSFMQLRVIVDLNEIPIDKQRNLSEVVELLLMMELGQFI